MTHFLKGTLGQNRKENTLCKMYQFTWTAWAGTQALPANSNFSSWLIVSQSYPWNQNGQWRWCLPNHAETKSIRRTQALASNLLTSRSDQALQEACLLDRTVRWLANLAMSVLIHRRLAWLLCWLSRDSWYISGTQGFSQSSWPRPSWR